MHHCILLSVNDRITTGRSSGIHRIASHLRLHDWDAEVIDFAGFWSLESLKELSRSRITDDTKFIGFSFLFDQFWPDHMEQYCKWIKETYPTIFLVSGTQGIGAAQSNNIDYYISGYGEYALDALLKWKVSNGPRPVFELFGNGKKIIKAIHSYPAYPLRDPIIRYQDRDFIVPGEWLGIEFSRGCKFKCDYCNYPILGVTEDYTRTAESFKEQITDAYDRFGVCGYYVSDETFNDRTDKITKFADVVESLSWDPYFTGFIRADLMISRTKDREELARMNFFGQFYGIESFNQQSIKSVGKGMAPERVQAGLLECKNYFQSIAGNKYIGTAGFIVGLPYETFDSLDQTKEWLSANWSDQTIMTFPLEIVKGNDTRPSAMSAEYEKYGYEEIKEFSTKGSFSRNSLNWKNHNMTRAQAFKYNKDRFQTTKMSKRFSNFEIADLILDDNLTLLSLEQKISVRDNFKEALPKYQEKARRFINRYIEKKLSL